MTPYLLIALNTIIYRLYINYSTYSFAYLDSDYNYKDNFMDIPLNSSTSIIMFICYAWIYRTLRKSRRISGLQQDNGRVIKKHDVRIAMQFSIIGAVFSCKGYLFCRQIIVFVISVGWLSLRAFPLIVPSELPQLFGLTTDSKLMGTAAVFLTMNNVVRKNSQLKEHFFFVFFQE